MTWRAPTDSEFRAILHYAYRAGLDREFTDNGRTDYDRLLNACEGLTFAEHPGRIDLGTDALTPTITRIKTKYKRGLSA
jgi:hypothetical protein